MVSRTNNKPTWLRYLPIVAIFVVTVVGFFTAGDYLNFDTLRDNHKVLIGFRDDNFQVTVLGFMAIYIIIVGFSLPGATLATITGGFLFGTPWGVLINITGATLGAVMIFLAVRMGFGEKLKARLDASEGKMRSIKNGIDENEWSMLFFLRLVPAVPFFVANLIPALLGVPLFRFAVSTFLGIIGAGLGLVFARGETPDLGIIFEPHILLPILGLCVLSLLPVLLKTITGKKELLK